MIPFGIILFSFVVVVNATFDCGGEGWSYYPPTGYCYGANINLPRNTFTNAEKYCIDNGGHLATITSLEEYKHILSYVFTSWDNYYGNWLGYYTDAGTNFDETNWKSVDGSAVEIMKFGKWCNEYRWDNHSPRVQGRRCLGIGWDQTKICYYDVDCDIGGRYATLKIICKRPPPKSFGAVVPVSIEKYDCGGEGWSYYPPTGYCYGADINLQRNNWVNAERYCKDSGGHLATITSLDEYRHLLSYIFLAWDNTYGNWIGYYTEDGTNYDDTKWISSDGSVVEISKYGKWCELPVAPVHGKRCLGMGYDSKKICFYDLDCNLGGRTATGKIICKRPPRNLNSARLVSPGKNECGAEGWSYYPPTGYCYGANINLQRNTYTNAERYCIDNGGHLTTITSLEEYKHILSYVFTSWDNYYGNWLGYYTDAGTNFNETTWKSVDGSVVEIMKFGKWCNEYRWDTQVPRVQGRRCLGIGWDQTKICYYDVDCDIGGRYAALKIICKRPPPKTFDAVAPISIEKYDCGGEGWSYYPPTGYCYGANINLQRTTWAKAEQYCKDNNGHLATITSLEEYRHFLKDGTNYNDTKWIASDGSVVEISKFGKWCNEYRWEGHSPPVNGKRCLGMGWDLTKICFYDRECDSNGEGQILKVICKRPPIGQPTPKFEEPKFDEPKYDEVNIPSIVPESKTTKTSRATCLI